MHSNEFYSATEAEGQPFTIRQYKREARDFIFYKLRKMESSFVNGKIMIDNLRFEGIIEEFIASTFPSPRHFSSKESHNEIIRNLTSFMWDCQDAYFSFKNWEITLEIEDDQISIIDIEPDYASR
jgi:hypothetical protein